ncbi:hypothetical protein DL96DRAFT_183484 [Flagelloscypha sp. PMI_526]|nr:hypothetical protein DL96DRAFT_183484 [Flagelloscypha sp. PMI_526]
MASSFSSFPSPTEGFPSSPSESGHGPPHHPPGPPPDGHHGPVNSSNLYIFTFLATLLVLLAISCLVVGRSFMLRRRYRRRLAEILAEGAISTPESPSSRRRVLRHMPQLHEAFISSPTTSHESLDRAMPFAVQFLKPRRRKKAAVESSTVTTSPSLFTRLFPRTPPVSATPTSHLETRINSEPATLQIAGDPEKSSHSPPTAQKAVHSLQMSFFIAMPSRRSWHSNHSGDAEIPILNIGTTRFRPPPAVDPSPSLDLGPRPIPNLVTGSPLQ